MSVNVFKVAAMRFSMWAVNGMILAAPDAILSFLSFNVRGIWYICPDAQIMTASSDGVNAKLGYVPIGAEMTPKSYVRPSKT
jgi:hypothetical protein